MAYLQQQQYAPAPQQQHQQYAPAPQQQLQGYGGGGGGFAPQMHFAPTNAGTAMPSSNDPVRLASRADVAKIHQLLVTSSRKALRATLSDAPEHERLAAEGDLDARIGEVMSMLLSATTFGGGDGENGGEGGEFDAAATVAVVAAAANASVPADAELAALQAEVDARAARVAALRAAAPRALRAAMMQRLAADDEEAAKKAEKSAEAGKPNKAAPGGGENENVDDDDPPPPAPLGVSFAATLSAMPGLRARVEEAADRLERAVEAMEAEASAPASGMTADLYYPLQERSSGRQQGSGEGAGRDGAAAQEEEEGAAAARALAAHARACLPR